MSEFKDKVVVITGAGGGLGKAHALEFARRGAKVVDATAVRCLNGQSPADFVCDFAVGDRDGRDRTSS